ncbi:hypothetical protein MKW98_023580 [Papaver atlanticum]|uniref:Uncharacterized protein n=1 Tax=Papaver atlanticum TaxID=357466 RepID=A0AAD4XMF7_9MAGN|nr:hypothetical protein MKW98_023580 [Papaver atlanticum]
MRALPREVDPGVYNMLHEDPGNISYSSVGGLSDQIHELRESTKLPLMNLELFCRVGIKPPLDQNLMSIRLIYWDEVLQYLGLRGNSLTVYRSLVFVSIPNLRLEGFAHKVLQWYLCRMEAWFAADADKISMKNWDQEEVRCGSVMSRSYSCH